MAISNLKIHKKNFLPIAYQDRIIRQLFPQFTLVKGNHIEATWEGELQPDKEMRKHKVIITYKLGEYPKVLYQLGLENRSINIKKTCFACTIKIGKTGMDIT